MSTGILPTVQPLRMTFEPKPTRFLIFACSIAVMGGVIYGYEVGNSDGLTSILPFLEKFFPELARKAFRRTVKSDQYCIDVNLKTLLFTSSLPFMALLSSLFVVWCTTRRYGAKSSMIGGAVIICLGVTVSTAGNSLWVIIVGRILIGIGIGFTNQSVPQYLIELASDKYRGAINCCFQLSIVIGTFLSNILSDYGENIIHSWTWRWNQGFTSIPALIMILGAWFLPQTPNRLIERERLIEAGRVLQRLRGLDNVDEEFNKLIEATEAARLVTHQWKTLMERNSMAILIPLFQQLTGITMVLFYAPTLFEVIGYGDNATLIFALVTGSVSVVANLIAIYVVDKWGRRFLFLEAGAQMIFFSVCISVSIGTKFGTGGQPGDLSKQYSQLLVFFICMYVAGYGWSWGPLGWLVPSEIFSLEVRSAAMSLTAAVNILFTFMVAQIYFIMLCGMKFGLFMFFAVWVVIMTVFVYVFVPETKNIPLEEMTEIWRTHWYWKRFIPPATSDHGGPSDHSPPSDNSGAPSDHDAPSSSGSGWSEHGPMSVSGCSAPLDRSGGHSDNRGARSDHGAPSDNRVLSESISSPFHHSSNIRGTSSDPGFIKLPRNIIGQRRCTF